MYVFLRYQTPVYNVTSSVLIKEDEKKGANAANGLAAIQDLGMLSMTSNFDNEVEILRSRTLIKKVVNDMGLYIDMEESNAWASTPLYTRTPPLTCSSPPRRRTVWWPPWSCACAIPWTGGWA